MVSSIILLYIEGWNAIQPIKCYILYIDITQPMDIPVCSLFAAGGV